MTAPKSETATPRTDEREQWMRNDARYKAPEQLYDTLKNHIDVALSHARDLERSLAEARRDGERLAKLALKVRNQRTELRRLNKYLGPYWAGFRRGLAVEGEVRLRGIMNKAFGHQAVRTAEHATLTAAAGEGEKT